MKRSYAQVYNKPEIAYLGMAGALTLGQINLAYPDGCNCSRSCAGDADCEDELLGC